MSNDTRHKPITNLKINLPEQMLPVLIPWQWDRRDRTGGHPLGGVRQLDPRDLDLYLTNKKKFEERYGPTDADAKELLFVVQLADARAAKSLPRLRRALERFIGPSETERELKVGVNVPSKLALQFNKNIVGALPFIYWDDRSERLVFGLHCPNISTALFLLAVQKVGVDAMGHCQGCGGVLIRDRPNKRFCDDNCRSRYYMRQLRERRKQKAKKKSSRRR